MKRIWWWAPPPLTLLNLWPCRPQITRLGVRRIPYLLRCRPLLARNLCRDCFLGIISWPHPSQEGNQAHEAVLLRHNFLVFYKEPIRPQRTLIQKRFRNWSGEWSLLVILHVICVAGMCIFETVNRSLSECKAAWNHTWNTAQVTTKPRWESWSLKCMLRAGANPSMQLTVLFRSFWQDDSPVAVTYKLWVLDGVSKSYIYTQAHIIKMIYYQITAYSI